MAIKHSFCESDPESGHINSSSTFTTDTNMDPLTFRNFELWGGAITASLPSNCLDATNFRPVPDHQEVYFAPNGRYSIIIDLLNRVSHLPTDGDAFSFHVQDILDEADRTQSWYSHIRPVELRNFPPNTPAYTLTASTVPLDAPNGSTFAPTSHTPSHTLTASAGPHDAPNGTTFAPISHTSAYTLTASAVPQDAPNGTAFAPSSHTPRSAALVVALIRLVPQSTDIVVTISLPHNVVMLESRPQVEFANRQTGDLFEEGMTIQNEIFRTLQIHDWGLFSGGE
ncbi:MAG: hypothetical protein Q9214_003700 [Letrouitia sp. 1 TL-2023]